MGPVDPATLQATQIAFATAHPLSCFSFRFEEQFSLDMGHHPGVCLGNVRLAGYLHPPVTNKIWCCRIESWFSAVEICIFSQAYFEALRFFGTFRNFEVLLGTFRYVRRLFGTFRNFEVLLGTLRYF